MTLNPASQRGESGGKAFLTIYDVITAIRDKYPEEA